MSWNWCSSTVSQARPQRLGRVVEQPGDRGGRRPQLGLAQQVLAAAVALLDLRLGGVGAAVDLEVELAGPHRSPRRTPPRRASKNAAGARPAPAATRQVGGTASPRQHPAGRAAAPVAVAERHQRAGRDALVAEVGRRVGQVGAGQVGVVGVDRREVGEHSGAVDALPPEGVVREGVGGVPRDLLGQEPPHPGQRHDLRQRGGVAERVGQPDLVGLDPEVLRKYRLPCTNCRAIASPPTMLVSDSTHIPPTGTNRPVVDVAADPREQVGV